MAHRKAGGSATSLTDSQPKYLGIKLGDGQMAQPGSIIVRQRGTRYLAGLHVRTGRDHTLYATTQGIVSFATKRKKRFDDTTRRYSVVSVK